MLPRLLALHAQGFWGCLLWGIFERRRRKCCFCARCCCCWPRADRACSSRVVLGSWRQPAPVSAVGLCARRAWLPGGALPVFKLLLGLLPVLRAWGVCVAAVHGQCICCVWMCRGGGSVSVGYAAGADSCGIGVWSVLSQRAVKHISLPSGAKLCQDAPCSYSNEMHACVAFVHALVSLGCVWVSMVLPGCPVRAGQVVC